MFMWKLLGIFLIISPTLHAEVSASFQPIRSTSNIIFPTKKCPEGKLIGSVNLFNSKARTKKYSKYGKKNNIEDNNTDKAITINTGTLELLWKKAAENGANFICYDESGNANAYLKPIAIYIDSNPRNAPVNLNGVAIGKTPFTYQYYLREIADNWLTFMALPTMAGHCTQTDRIILTREDLHRGDIKIHFEMSLCPILPPVNN